MNNFEEYLNDLDLFLDRVRARLPGRPLFLMGHSMGGVIVTFYAVDREPRTRGMVLSAPAVKLTNEVSPLLQKAAAAIARFLPMLKTFDIDPLHHALLYLGDEIGIGDRLGAGAGRSEVVEHRHQHDSDDYPENQIFCQIVQSEYLCT